MTDIAWITAAERREEKYNCHHTNNIWVQALILKTVVTLIIKKWKSTHSNNTSLYNLWKWLKERYTEGNVIMKWSVITEVEGMNLSNHTNIDQYRSKYYDLAHQIDDLKITLKDALMLKVLNNLDLEYNQFMAVLTSEVWTKSDDINSEYIWKALKQEEKQAAVRSKQQANAAMTWKDTRGGNNFHIENRHKTCKSCKRAYKTDPGIVCYNKGQICEECDITEHQRRNHSRELKANNKKSKDDQSDNGSDSDKATKSITCCITTLYTLKSASDLTADIRFNVTDCLILTINVAQLHNNIRSLLKKLVLDSGTTAHLIANKNLIQGYYEDFEQY